MNEVQFCYWLKGYFELSNSNELTPEQVAAIKEHLSLVFNKVTLLNVGDQSMPTLFTNTQPVITC